MKKYKNFSLTNYLAALSSREPVPGGGSAAALVGSSGVSLLIMVARYSLGKGKPKVVEAKIQRIIDQAQVGQRGLLALVDRDSQAYLAYSKIPKTNISAKKKASQEAARIPKEICRICYKTVCLTPTLVQHGNKYLISDLEIALEFLWAAYRSAFILTKQS